LHRRRQVEGLAGADRFGEALGMSGNEAQCALARQAEHRNGPDDHRRIADEGKGSEE
jgi:hypothetical protein